MVEDLEPMDNERLAKTGTAIYNLLLAARIDPTLRRWAQIANDGFEFLSAELAVKETENERLREACQRAWDFAVFVHFHEETAKHGQDCDLPLEASILADLMARTLQPKMFE